jgi:hypothetical protein
MKLTNTKFEKLNYFFLKSLYMKNLEYSLTMIQENYKSLFKLGLNKDVIEIILKYKNEKEFYENKLYHFNCILQKTRNSSLNEYSIPNCIPKDNNHEFKLKLEWCIKYEHDQNHDFLTNRIEIVSDKKFMIEKIEKDKFYENYKYDENKIQFIQNDFIYLLPTVFSKIKFLNKINDIKLLEIYEENDIYIYMNE